jgi:hypothetical protein
VRLVLLLLAVLALGGCGGGGGGGTTNAQLVGRVLWVESNAAPDPVASVSSGSNTTTTDVIDGSFVLAVPVGTTSVTVSYSDGGPPVVFTFTFPAASGTVDVGDLYIGPETVTVHGTVRDASNDQPVPGATVTLGGRTALTDANGEFNLLNVAYSSSAPAAFGDLVGEVTKTAYVTRQFNPPTTAVGGVVEVGVLQFSPTSQDQPPPFPANITGTVLPVNDGAGALVELLDGTMTVVRSTVADGAGKFQFWAGAGTYTVRATKGALSGTAPVTVTAPNVQEVVNVNLS